VNVNLAIGAPGYVYLARWIRDFQASVSGDGVVAIKRAANPGTGHASRQHQSGSEKHTQSCKTPMNRHGFPLIQSRLRDICTYFRYARKGDYVPVC
jgi:hypothetical protein